MPEQNSADTSQAQAPDLAQVSQQLDTIHQDLTTLNQTCSNLTTLAQEIKDGSADTPGTDYSSQLDAISGNVATVTQAVQDYQQQEQEQATIEPAPDYSQQNADNVQTVTYCALLVTAAVAIALGFEIFDRFFQAWKMRG